MSAHNRNRAALFLLLAIAGAAPILAQDSGEGVNPFLRFLFGWAPLLVIIFAWFYFMRRMKAGKIGRQVERSLEHMDRLEQQNERILEILERIERHLRP